MHVHVHVSTGLHGFLHVEAAIATIDLTHYFFNYMIRGNSLPPAAPTNKRHKRSQYIGPAWAYLGERFRIKPPNESVPGIKAKNCIHKLYAQNQWKTPEFHSPTIFFLVKSLRSRCVPTVQYASECTLRLRQCN